MFKPTSTQASSTVASTQGSAPDAPAEPSSNPADTLEKQESAQRKVEIQLAKFESAQIKHIELLKQIARAHDQKDLHQAKLNLHADHLAEIRSQANELTTKLANKNMAQLQTPSKHTTPSEFGNIDAMTLAKLIKNDPELNQLGKRLHTEQKSSYEENKKITSINSAIDNLSKNKESIKANVDESMMELTQALNVLQAVKPGAANVAEIDLLLGIAQQKIATAHVSIASLTLNQAQKNFSQAQLSLNNSSSKLNEISKNMNLYYTQLNAAQDEFLKSGKYQNSNLDIKKYQAEFLSTPEHQSISWTLSKSLTQHQSEFNIHSILARKHALADMDFIGAKIQFEKSENLLKEANSAVAKAKLALNQHILDDGLTSCIDGAILTDAAPAPATDHSQAMHEPHLEEQVTAVGTPPTFDAL